jgi:hypothetical protein
MFTMKTRLTTVPRKVRRLSSIAVLAVAVLGLPAVAPAQGLFGETVAWTLSAPPAESVKPGSRVVLSLQGAVRDTWHVYGLKQLPAGPTPLRVALEPGGVATADGAPSANAPIKVHDPSFDLETQYYTREVAVKVPVRIAARAAAGPQQIPLTVRYQTCDGRVCQPPKSIRLSATVNVRGG